MNARVFIVVAVILLFLNVETPEAFLRHQVGGQDLQGGGLEGRLPGHRCRNLSRPFCAICGAGTTLRFQDASTWFGPAPSARKKPRATTRPRRLLRATLVLTEDPSVHETPAWVDVTHCKYGTLQEADAAVEHALGLGGVELSQPRLGLQRGARFLAARV